MTGSQRHLQSRLRVAHRLLGVLTLLFLLLLFSPSPASAQGLGGSAELQYNTSETVTDAQKAASDQFRQNYNLRFNKKITPILSYGLYLRTSLTDSTDTDISQITRERSQRDVEPMLELLLQNPIYSLNTGYRRLESLQEQRPEGTSTKLTTGYFYSRLDIKPVDLPNLSLQYDRRSEADGQNTVDSLLTTYSAASSYIVAYKNINAGYNLRYSGKISETPLQVVNKNIDELLAGQYTLGYTKSFFSGRLRVSSSYRGDYTQNINEIFSTTGGTVLSRRLPLQGLYDTQQGTPAQPNVDTLNTVEPALIDADVAAGIPALNIGTIQFLNAGMQVSSVQTVSRLYIYVNRDVRTDSSLTQPANWRAYKNNANSSWQTLATVVSIQSVSVSPVDALNNIYRYELVFSSAQSAGFYKVINLETVAVPGSPGMDVFVTEIEAYGAEFIAAGSSLRRESVFFNQGLAFNAGLRALPKLELSFNYSVSRSDQGPHSILNSAGGLFQNIFSRTTSDAADPMISDVSRVYGISANWKTHPLLATVIRIQRNESFDNKETRDFASHNYSLSFSSAPLPTLDLNLLFSRSDNFSFDQKTGTNNSAQFSAGARLYRNVTMVMDTGYTQTESATTDLKTATLFLSTNLQARLTPKLSGNMVYRFNSSLSGSEAPASHEGHVSVSYRPGRLVNMSANLKMLTAGEDRTLQGAFSLDWRPLRALSLSGRFDLSSTLPEQASSFGFNSSLRWQIFRFMDAQLNYTYRVNEDPGHKTTAAFIGGRLNCSF